MNYYDIFTSYNTTIDDIFLNDTFSNDTLLSSSLSNVPLSSESEKDPFIDSSASQFCILFDEIPKASTERVERLAAGGPSMTDLEFEKDFGLDLDASKFCALFDEVPKTSIKQNDSPVTLGYGHESNFSSRDTTKPLKRNLTSDDMNPLPASLDKKERNRLAAARCRQRKNETIDFLSEKCSQLEFLNEKLMQENLALKNSLKANSYK